MKINNVVTENLNLVDANCTGKVWDLSQELFCEVPHLLLTSHDLEFNRDICMANLLILMMLETNPQKILDIFIKHINDCCDIEEDENKVLLLQEGLFRSMHSIYNGRVVQMMVRLSQKSNCEEFTYDKLDQCLGLISDKAEEFLEQGVKSPNYYPSVWDYYENPTVRYYPSIFS